MSSFLNLPHDCSAVKKQIVKSSQFSQLIRVRLDKYLLMGDQQNQMIKGNASQYVKLNIGGETKRKMPEIPIENFFGVETTQKIPMHSNFLFRRIPLLYDNQDTDESRLHAQSNVFRQTGSADR